MPRLPAKIIVDTGPLIAWHARRDPHHGRAIDFAKAVTGDLFTTWPVVTEACHFLNQAGKAALLAMLDAPRMHVEDLYPADRARLRELVRKYERMDLADASLVVIAERLGVLDIATVDRAEFEAIYRTGSGRSFINHFPRAT